jgi:hypothetical protein
VEGPLNIIDPEKQHFTDSERFYRAFEDIGVGMVMLKLVVGF